MSSITKKPKLTKGYQHQYEPPTLTENEKIRIKNLTDAKLANSEVDRVARNIATAIANPDTPEIVHAYITAYLDDLFSLDSTQTPEAIFCLYPIVCRKISQIPFVPQKEYIEALTGNDRKRAIDATKEDHDLEPHTSLTVERANQLTDTLFELEQGDDEARAVALIALIRGIGHETSPFYRKRLVHEVSHRAYSHTIEHSDAEREFISMAVETNRKERRK